MRRFVGLALALLMALSFSSAVFADDEKEKEDVARDFKDVVGWTASVGNVDASRFLLNFRYNFSPYLYKTDFIFGTPVFFHYTDEVKLFLDVLTTDGRIVSVLVTGSQARSLPLFYRVVHGDILNPSVKRHVVITFLPKTGFSYTTSEIGIFTVESQGS